MSIRMSLDQSGRFKKKIENEIASLIIEFQEKTGLCVIDVEVHMVDVSTPYKTECVVSSVNLKLKSGVLSEKFIRVLATESAKK